MYVECLSGLVVKPKPVVNKKKTEAAIFRNPRFQAPALEGASRKVFNRYRERGLSLIPIKPGEKRPDCGEEWQKYCDRLPTEDECDLWESTKAKRYGLALGRASGVMAVDVDSDDPKILGAVKPSPVRKRGKKGETLFFRWSEDISSCKVAGCIDILSHGRQTVMPPTTHPETNQPYVWLTPDTLDDFDVADLPEFTARDLAELRHALEPGYEIPGAPQQSVPLTGGPWYNDDPKRLCPHGSHDRLKMIANAIISRGASPDEAVRELLRYDEENHLPVPYFADHTRPDCQADPVTNALFFYASNARTFNRRQMKSGQAPSVPLVSGAELVDVSALSRPMGEAFKKRDWPEPSGGLKEIRDQIAEFSVRDQPAIAIGGAIAIGATAIANRFRLGDLWPNVYVINVAPTGAGKSFPYDTAKRLLNQENGLDLLGAGGYRSSSALMKDLAGRRERLDMIDECSSLFKVIRDGGVFQQDMLDILNMLWSNSSSIFVGPESMGKERVNVWHPCISSLFSTTPDGLRGSVSRDFVTQGFIPRCLLFADLEYGQIRKPKWNEARAERIVRLLQEMQSWGKTDSKNLVAPKPQPSYIEIDEAAAALLTEYSEECSETLADKDRDETERHFLTRAGQQAGKLAMIHGALDKLRVTVPDVEWAIATLQTSWHNSSTILSQVGAENTQENNVMRVLTTIRSNGNITHSALIGKTRFLRTNERHEILSSLENEGKIQKRVDGRITTYHII